MADVFISYSRKDEAFGRKLYEELKETQKRQVWMDWRNIPEGEEWWREICKGIQEANNFVLLLSPDSLASPVCNLEICEAIKHGKRIVPVLHRETDAASAFGSLAARQLSDFQLKLLVGRDIMVIARDNWQAVSAINFLAFKEDDDFDAKVSDLLEVIDTDHDYVSEHTQLEQRAVEWDENQRRSGFLLRGEALLGAEDWLERSAGKPPTPTELQIEYVQASIAERTRQEQMERQRQTRELQRLRYFVGILGVSLLIVAVMALIAFSERNRANRRANEARSLALARGVQDALDAEQPFVAFALAIEANQIDNPSFEAREALYDTVGELLPSNTFREYVLAIQGIAFSPDGLKALSGSGDETMILWDVATGEAIRRFDGHTEAVTSVAFSPDGRTALAGSREGTIILWDVATGESIYYFPWRTGAVTSVAFSPDGLTVLAGSSDGAMILWDVATGEVIRHFSRRSDGISSVAFSPDGHTALSGSRDFALILWDVATGNIVHRFEGHHGPVNSVAFSPDGQTVLAGGQGSYESGFCALGDIILWDVATGNIVRRFEGHDCPVSNVAFSPDGRTALSGSYDHTFILWDVEAGEALHRFEGYRSPVYRVASVAFSPDGQTVLTSACTTQDDSCEYGELILWWVLASPGSLLHWAQNYRSAPELTCEQRALYVVDVQCDTNGVFPTRTPFPTLTPSPTPIPRVS